MVSCLSLNKRSDRHLDTYSHFHSNLLKLGAQCHLNGKTGKYDLPNILNLCTYRYENRQKKKSQLLKTISQTAIFLKKRKICNMKLNAYRSKTKFIALKQYSFDLTCPFYSKKHLRRPMCTSKAEMLMHI